MRSILDDITTTLKGITYPITTTVRESYSGADGVILPVVVVDEIVNTPYSESTTGEDSLQEERTLLSYQITIYADDSETTDGDVLSRNAAARLIGQTIADELYSVYGLTRVSFGPSLYVDATSISFSIRFSGVMDSAGYMYTS